MLGSRYVALFLVIGLTAIAPAQVSLAERVQLALQKARPALLLQLDDSVQDTHAVMLGLSCLAAVHDGVPFDDPHQQPALERLAKVQTVVTQELALRLLVAEACEQFPGRMDLAAADLQALLKNRLDGAFGHAPEPKDWDILNTQWGALGMRAAASLGLDVPRRAWSMLADRVKVLQAANGGWPLRHGTEAGPETLTTLAGLTALLLCRQALGVGHAPSPDLEKRIERGWSWITKHHGHLVKPVLTQALAMQYGVERAAVLDDREQIDGVDWYVAGAEMLLKQQTAEGAWNTQTAMLFFGNGKGPESHVDTAYAILFLRRTFPKYASPITSQRRPTLIDVTDKSSDAAVMECGEAMGRRGNIALADVMQGLRSEVVPRRRAALLALRMQAGEDFGIDPAKDATANRQALAKADAWFLKVR